jgi:sugar phosphate isomerase/epimerase
MTQTTPTRRDVLRLGGLAAASAILGPAIERAADAAPWKPIPIGTQLWCVRKQLATDVPGTLKALAGAGFEGVELENAFGKPGPEWRKYLDEARLKPCGFHHRLDELQGDKLAQTIEFNQAIGNRNLVIRSLAKEVYNSADLLEKTAEAVNEAASRVKPHGLRVGYHNHTTDFNRIDGEYWWNRFADRTSKDVLLQLDTGNASAMAGGVPLADLIRRNAGRTVTMHIKPHSTTNPDAYIGKDDLDWPAIMTAAESVGGIEWYIIEYEREGVPPLESLRSNLDAFKALRAR